MKEKWKLIENSEYYEISNLGRVRNYLKQDILRGSLSSSGYRYVSININGKFKSELIFRLVANAFIPNPKNYKVVNHIDENK